MNYSFRKKNKIVKYIVIHYTGMLTFGSAYQKLNKSNSEVSAHYLISRKGLIVNFLCPRLKAWHAGKSQWKEDKDINETSIGIELENKGHEFGYQEFTNHQYISLKKLINFLIKVYRIDHKNILFHSDISPNRKKDPGENFDLKKLGIYRFRYELKRKENISLKKMLLIYGFSKNYVKNYFFECIIAVKRSIRYKTITPIINKRFKKDFYNLLIK